MAIIRAIQCDWCGKKEIEKKVNDGFWGWGGLHGKINKETNNAEFSLCPEHLEEVFNYIFKNKGVRT